MVRRLYHQNVAGAYPPLFLQSLLHHLPCRNTFYSHLLNRKRGRAVGEIHGFAWVCVPIQVTEESGREDIARTRRVYLSRGVGSEMPGSAVLEEGRSMPSIGCDKQGYL